MMRMACERLRRPLFTTVSVFDAMPRRLCVCACVTTSHSSGPLSLHSARQTLLLLLAGWLATTPLQRLLFQLSFFTLQLIIPLPIRLAISPSRSLCAGATLCSLAARAVCWTQANPSKQLFETFWSPQLCAGCRHSRAALQSWTTYVEPPSACAPITATDSAAFPSGTTYPDGHSELT